MYSVLRSINVAIIYRKQGTGMMASFLLDISLNLDSFFFFFFFTKDRLFREIFINLKKDSLNFNGDDDVFEGKTCLRGGIKTKKKKVRSRERKRLRRVSKLFRFLNIIYTGETGSIVCT